MSKSTATLIDHLRSMTWWTAGTCREDMARMPARVQMQYTTVGLVMVLNLAILQAAWSKIGWHYFGWFGLIIPGLAVPCIFVMGLDRLVAMSRRRMVGDLAAYEPRGPKRRNLERWFRVGIASVFSALTTFTLMLEMSSASIQAYQSRTAAVANEPLRREYEQRLFAANHTILEQGEQRLGSIEERQRALQAQMSVSRTTLGEAEARARVAREEMARERGGLDRSPGEGRHFEAQRGIAETNESTAQAQRTRLAAQGQEFALLENEAAMIRTSRVKAQGDLSAQAGGLANQMKSDPRYVAPQHGLFSDATAFVALYHDKEEGPGRWWLSLLLGEVLFGLECAALLALKLNPESPLEVVRLEGTLETAAAIKTDAMLRQVKGRARSSQERPRRSGSNKTTAPP